jgi:cell division transport system ATP-binding protein
MIVFSSVTKQFFPESIAVEDVSFEIEPGELVVITGPSGSGKTTLMRLLTKEYLPSSGEILFHNISLDDIPDSQVFRHRRQIGVVFQDYKLISELNVWENIALPLSIVGKEESEIETRVTDLLTLVSLTDKAFYFPKQLSGGEAQRISIARALSTGPKVLFADEPTGNLDAESSVEIAKLLERINSFGTTVLFATHDTNVIDLLTKNYRHLTMEKGKLVSDSDKKSSKTKTNFDKKVDVRNDESKTEKKESQDKVADDSNIEDLENIKPDTVVKKSGFWSNLFSKKVATDISKQVDLDKEEAENEKEVKDHEKEKIDKKASLETETKESGANKTKNKKLSKTSRNKKSSKK